MSEKVLVTGGAGYIGSVLVGLLLNNGYKVRVLDLLKYGGESLLEFMNHSDFEFIKGDVRKKDDISGALNGIDYVVNLAAIVGDPACAKFPGEAKSINLEGTKILYEFSNLFKVKKFIFASTCSNYGKMEDPESFVDETSKLAPVSLYAETKVAAEQFLLAQAQSSYCKPVCLRFSTVYGLSPRTRFDLTVNEFTKELALGRELVIFGGQFWRPYCHVVDLARSVISVIQADKKCVEFNVFNVGDTQENYTKKMLADEIVKQLPSSVIKFVNRTEDPRDYRVSFKKINKELGFVITRKVPDGIRQIIRIINEGFILNPDDKKYKNV